MPSGLQGRQERNDAVDEGLLQVLTGIKKLPGNALGAPVDLANTVLNIMKAGAGYVGSKTGLLKADQLPQLEDRPVGGSSWINKQFGMDKSTGKVDDITQLVGGFITPGNMATVAKATILPALLLKDSSTVSTAARFLEKGANPDAVYKSSGVFRGLEENAPLKAVLPDTNATLQPVGGVLRTTEKNPYYTGPAKLESTSTKLPKDFEGYLPDVLDHPDLFAAMPALKDVKVRAGNSLGEGSYNRETNTITVGPMAGTKGETSLTGKDISKSSDESFMSVLLHETQHAIQAKSGFTQGGNSGQFLRDQSAVRVAQSGAASSGNKADIDALNKMLDSAHDNYLNIGGELEAQIVQAQRNNPALLKQSPAKLAETQAGGKENIITDPKSAPKLDDDESVRKIIDYYNPSF